MFPNHLSSGEVHQKRSSALIIMLGFLVLICGILLVFFNLGALNRQISFSSAGQYRADVLAHTALDTTIGDIQTEISAGSTVYSSNNVSVYIPTTNFTAVPCAVANQGFTNLIAQSASTSNFWTGTYYNGSVVSPVRAAANNSTQTPSANGRFIQISRWNKPGLLGDPGSGTVPQMTNTSPSTGNPYTPPDWILVTRQGAITNATFLPSISVLASRNVTNFNYVVGRYAYAIYDEGGLLDVNVAGYPNSGANSVSGTDFTTKRGVLPQIDLANLLNNAAISDATASADANALVNWRNQATAATATSYTNYILTATNGFTTVAAGDQAFVSRQDLISYIKNDSSIPTSALSYLGTFSREINAPSYTPSPSRPKVQVPVSAAFNKDDNFNPSLINTRVITPFSRASDGLTSSAGEPFIKYRFPLSRLALVTTTATADTSSLIYKYFGLTRSATTAPWVYNHGKGFSIATLSQITSAGTYGPPREPDFFELLMAAISAGSLGKYGLSTFSNQITSDQNMYNQVIQIGANLIDQYKTDSYPTRISFGSPAIEFYGIQNLPYLHRIMPIAYRYHGPSEPTSHPRMGEWYQAELWNPHAQAASPPANGPTHFRYICTGSAKAAFGSTPTDSDYASAVNDFSSSQGILFSTSSANSFSEPTILAPPWATATGNDSVSDSTVSFVGINIGIVNPVAGSSLYTTDMPVGSVTHQLQYQDTSGQWLPYSQFKAITGDIGANPSPNSTYNTPYPPLNAQGAYGDSSEQLTGSDPRTSRFGVIGGTIAGYTRATGLTAWWSAASNSEAWATTIPTTGWFFPTHGPHWSSSQPSIYPGSLSENTTTSATYYSDTDSTTRRGDAAYGNINNPSVGTGVPGYPLLTGNTDSRPIMLNRPFRSVGDMGYASRDEPWKELDFFTPESADSALLDLFCLNESASQVQAGRINLNTRQQPVLTAILEGAIKSEVDNTVISPTEAASLSANLVSLTASLPLLNRNELVTRWVGAISYSTTPDTIIKRRREAAIRALADCGNTRTWNLLIDVIAQSGRYPSAATSLDQFVVEGERRYWLHIAIDRYTGRVVAQYLEPVYE